MPVTLAAVYHSFTTASCILPTIKMHNTFRMLETSKEKHQKQSISMEKPQKQTTSCISTTQLFQSTVISRDATTRQKQPSLSNGQKTTKSFLQNPIFAPDQNPRGTATDWRYSSLPVLPEHLQLNLGWWSNPYLTK
jgi:hypothetical protein